ncbi:23212_t:CDS:2 [Dentiscutata erythropus]|uniref:23212_t:CDS:1 n=1 Tax=Dentiscutata erythropus TaxID=1348616 RepID=A0A9N9DCA4_9GLOM|nr:23212_t:CDS:2 [Dentiscutata erythropus]
MLCLFEYLKKRMNVRKTSHHKDKDNIIDKVKRPVPIWNTDFVTGFMISDNAIKPTIFKLVVISL